MMNQNPILREKDFTWIENLALEELHMEESGFINFNPYSNIEKIIEESSMNFMNQLKDRFDFYVSLFNQHRLNRDQGRAIKTFRISNTINDFMLFRNSLKLIVARKNFDVISIGFLSQSGNLFSPRLSQNENPMPQTQMFEIKAHVGAFNKISWQYQGDEVEIESLVKFYLSDFIRFSAR
jgi:hypothetical protein